MTAVVPRDVGQGSVRDQFVEQSEDWIKRLARDLPEDYLQYAMSGKALPDDLIESAPRLTPHDPMHMVLLLRCMRAVEKMVEQMPGDIMISTLAAPSDFGVLARALSDPRVSGPTPEADPLAGAVGRSIGHRQALMEMAGEMLSSAQVQDLLGIKRQAIDKRRKAGKLLAVRLASDWHYPAFQFVDGGILPELEGVLQVHSRKDPWVVLDILLAPDEALGGRTLLKAMQDGDGRAIARHIAQARGDGFA